MQTTEEITILKTSFPKLKFKQNNHELSIIFPWYLFAHSAKKLTLNVTKKNHMFIVTDNGDIIFDANTENKDLTEMYNLIKYYDLRTSKTKPIQIFQTFNYLNELTEILQHFTKFAIAVQETFQ